MVCDESQNYKFRTGEVRTIICGQCFRNTDLIFSVVTDEVVEAVNPFRVGIN